MKICDFTMPELDMLRAKCNFTKDEMQVFDVLADGKTIEESAYLTSFSVSTIKRTKNKIKAKIERILSL